MARNEHGERCALCGEVAAGSAYVGSARYCHGDYDSEPTCYMRASNPFWDRPLTLVPVEHEPEHH